MIRSLFPGLIAVTLLSCSHSRKLKADSPDAPRKDVYTPNSGSGNNDRSKQAIYNSSGAKNIDMQRDKAIVEPVK